MNTPSANDLLQQAISAHKQLHLVEAEKLYHRFLSQIPTSSEARYNLAMVKLGLNKLQSGSNLLRNLLLDTDINELPLDGFIEAVKIFYRNRYWEEAYFWAERAMTKGSQDPYVAYVYDRSKPRDYLKPEIYDALSGKVLKRYSPRESDTYVYTIDITGTCNLNCPSCPVGVYDKDYKTKGFMSLALFQAILEKIEVESPAKQPAIWLYNWGEPLINPDVARMIRLINEKGFTSHLSSNLNVKKELEDIIRENPTELKISISGFHESTYRTHHRGGDLNLVKSNLYRLRYLLDRHKATTRVWIGQHIYKDTQDQSVPMRQLAKELGFEYHPIAAYIQPIERLYRISKGITRPEDQDIIDKLLTEPKDQVRHSLRLKTGNDDCELRFNQTVINFDGSVALCCNVYEKQNMLHVNFLDMSHQEIDDLKYQHPFCQTCRKNGLDYSPSSLMENP